jgi:hypothetical protein
MYPRASHNIAMTVQPGDTITAQVNYSAGVFTLQLSDTPKNGGPVENFSINRTLPGAKLSSAEWIQEAPSSFFGILPLSNFGTINFSGAQATINGVTGPIDNSAWSSEVRQINMVTSRGAAKDTTSGLTDSASGSAFTVTWVSSGGAVGFANKHATVRDPNQPAVQTSLSSMSQASSQTIVLSSSSSVNQAAAQTAAIQEVAQSTRVSPFTLTSTASFPTSNAASTNSILIAMPGPSLSGPTQVSPYKSFISSILTGDEVLSPNGAQPAAKPATPLEDPEPMGDPSGAVPSAAVPAVHLSDACFIENGAALAAPESPGAPDQKEEKLTTIEGADSVCTLALGGLIALAAETSSRRWAERTRRNPALGAN